MRMSHFFIDRPIFAGVISVIIVILGAVSYGRLPIAQYPEIAPPVVNVTGQYPGASAEVVASTVVAPLEQQINGVEKMLYISSNSTGDGRFSISITFDLGTNLDIAQVQVQNRVTIAEPRLPEEVRRLGVSTRKQAGDFLMVVHLLSPDKRYDELYIANYMQLRIRDELLRLEGVGNIVVVTSAAKLATLPAGALLVDTGDAALDAKLCGHRSVIVGPGRTMIVAVKDAARLTGAFP